MKRSLIFILVILILCPGCMTIQPVSVTRTAPSTKVPVTAAPPEKDSGTPTPPVAVTPEVTAGLTETPAPAIPTVNETLLQSATDDMETDIHCPDISGMQDEAFQAELNSKTYDDLRLMAEDMAAGAAEDTEKPSRYYMYTTFSVCRNEGVFLSISINIEYYNGGANTGTDIEFINVKNSRPADALLLGELFAPGTDYIGQINGIINGQIAADPEMEGITFSTIDEGQLFYITDTELVIAFKSYTIAPGAFGTPEFRIPLSTLTGILPELL